jgi:hypothetical protein
LRIGEAVGKRVASAVVESSVLAGCG